jgi:hypothetical protein
MSSDCNTTRANEAAFAIESFARVTQDDPCAVEPFTQRQMLLIYFLADVRHYCDARGWDYGALDKEGYQAYLGDRAHNPIAELEDADAV